VKDLSPIVEHGNFADIYDEDEDEYNKNEDGEYELNEEEDDKNDDKEEDAANNIVDDNDDQVFKNNIMDDDDDEEGNAENPIVDDDDNDEENAENNIVDDGANIDPNIFLHPGDDVNSILCFFADDSNYENTERGRSKSKQ
jgi:hypothetical protein